MATIKIQHTTTYRFNEPVNLLPHRLMLRPRETRDLRVISSHITVTPAATLKWAHDVFGNAVATAATITTAAAAPANVMARGSFIGLTTSAAIYSSILFSSRAEMNNPG